MKKKVKKLVLAKETVRDLSLRGLGHVAGGTAQSCYCTIQCWSSPDYSCQNEIPTGAQPTCAG